MAWSVECKLEFLKIPNISKRDAFLPMLLSGPSKEPNVSGHDGKAQTGNGYRRLVSDRSRCIDGGIHGRSDRRDVNFMLNLEEKCV